MKEQQQRREDIEHSLSKQSNVTRSHSLAPFSSQISMRHRGKQLDPPHPLGCIQPSLALPCSAASLKPAGTAHYPRPGLCREPAAARPRTAAIPTCPGTRSGSTAAVLTGWLCQGLFLPWALYVQAPVCESAAGPAPWNTGVPNEALPTGAPAPPHSPSVLPEPQGSCCVLTSSQPSAQEM